MTFEASVQYNDYRGTVALDRSDSLRLSDEFVSRKLISDGEVIVAVRLSMAENHGNEVDSVGVIVYVHEANGYVARPNEVRAVETEMRWSQCFSYFKRFDLVFSSGDRDLSSTQINYPHYDS